jgi:hypothetical protein
LATADVKKGPILWRGIVGLLGLFCGLCAIFALVVTVAQAWEEHAQAQWPQVTARTQNCAMVLYSYKAKTYHIECRITYVLGSEEVGTLIHSRSTPAPQRVLGSRPAAQVELMEDWVQAHSQGTPISVHYDPANHRKAALVTTDMPLGGPNTPNNLKLLGFFASACIVLLTISRIATLRSDANAAVANV